MRSGRAAASACVNGVSSRSAAIATSRPSEPQRRGCAAARRHEPGLGEDLEAVADAEHEAAVARRTRATARMTGLNRAITPGPQVVAVGEAAGQDDRGDAVERRLLVPQRRPARRRPARARGACRGRSCCPGRRRRRSGRSRQPPPRRRPTTPRRAARPRTPRSAGSTAARAASRSTTARAAASSAAVDGQLDPPADADVADALDPEVAEAALDRPALRVEDARAWA